MNKLLASALAVLVGCATEDTSFTGYEPELAVDVDGPAPAFRPARCQEVVDLDPELPDGAYTLYFKNDAGLRWLAYCADMQGTPREYLSLEGANTAMLATTAGSVITSYERVRIDPETATVDISDKSFATTTGSVMHDGVTVNAVPFGVAMGCDAEASGAIDLRGTPFRLEAAFPRMGTNASGTTDLSLDRKVQAVSVKGACGWVAPSDRTKPLAQQAVLRLAYFR